MSESLETVAKENTQENLNKLLLALKKGRLAYEDYRSQARAMVENVQKSIPYLTLKSHMDMTGQSIETLEETVKAMALEIYKLEKNKKVNPFIEVKTFTQTLVSYDKQTAHEWALTHNTAVLDLNEKEFEKIVAAGKVPKEIATFITLETPKAQIASNLEKVE